MSKYLNEDEKLTPEGQELAARLYDPAVGAMLTWLADGEAASQSRYGDVSQVVLNTAQADRYLREDIAVETFVRALPPFLGRLDRGEYDADRGATITTYFIGACRNRIGDVIRAHHVRVIELRANTDELLARVQGTTVDANMIEGFEFARDLLLAAPRNLRSVLLLLAYEGVTLTEAAKRVGVKPATVRSQLLRYKKQIAWLHFRGVLEIPADTALGEWVRAQTEERRTAANRGEDALPIS
ncbi:sigma-70 family RNA polymerase sigma factor [Nocardia sp. NPDC050713]|uniref:RNA polymerase sigma factor n=1 Tax=Nocardia sp. NPDC050713 TaxID=3154511 RepID=UPI0033C348F7